MAVLEKIRSHSVLLVVVIGIALAGFVIGDLFTSGRTFWSKNERTALSIDGKDVSIEEYSMRLKELEDQAQAQGQQLSDEQRMQLNNQLAQEYISEYALNEVTSKVGLGVSDDELYALLVGKGIAPSPLAAQFFGSADEKQINEIIKQLSDKQIQAAPAEQRGQLLQAKSQFEQLQKQIKSQRLQQKLSTLLARTYKINDVDRELSVGKESRSIALVRTSAAQIADEAAKPSDSEVKKYYDEHKDFYKMQYPLTEVNYISLQVTPSQEDYKKLLLRRKRLSLSFAMQMPLTSSLYSVASLPPASSSPRATSPVLSSMRWASVLSRSPSSRVLRLVPSAILSSSATATISSSSSVRRR